MFRLGVIGVGGHALDSHLIAGSQSFRLTNVFDPNHDRVLTVIKRLGLEDVTTHDTLASFLKHAKVDAILIASPDQFHATQLLEVVKTTRGPVLVEKPLGITFRDIWRVRKALRIAKRRGVTISSCHPRREDPPYQWIKEHLAEFTARFGVLKHVELDFSYPEPSAGWKTSGRSLLLDHFPHEIDFIRWLLGDRAFSAQRLKDSPVEYTVSGTLAGGVTFLCNGTRTLERREPRGIFPETVELRFERGTVTLNTYTGRALIYDHEVQEYSFVAGAKTDYDSRFWSIMLNFGAVVADTQECYLKPEDLTVNTRASIILARRGKFRYTP